MSEISFALLDSEWTCNTRKHEVVLKNTAHKGITFKWTQKLQSILHYTVHFRIPTISSLFSVTNIRLNKLLPAIVLSAKAHGPVTVRPIPRPAATSPRISSAHWQLWETRMVPSQAIPSQVCPLPHFTRTRCQPFKQTTLTASPPDTENRQLCWTTVAKERGLILRQLQILLAISSFFNHQKFCLSLAFNEYHPELCHLVIERADFPLVCFARLTVVEVSPSPAKSLLWLKKKKKKEDALYWFLSSSGVLTSQSDHILNNW